MIYGNNDPGVTDSNWKCPVCGKEETEYDQTHDCGEVCQSCLIQYAKDFDFAKGFLQDQPTQRIGKTSWTDFVLNYCFGIPYCDNPAMTTELLGCFEADSILEDEHGLNFVVGEVLADYAENSMDWADYVREHAC